MNITFSPRGWRDYLHWQEENSTTLHKLNALIKECSRTPFMGTGKPEPLRGELKGWWSRRITDSDRMLYRVTGSGVAQQLEIAACRLHYE